MWGHCTLKSQKYTLKEANEKHMQVLNNMWDNYLPCH